MNDLVNRIANGEATLLGVEEICKRLGVSRSTFERWVRNGTPERRAPGIAGLADKASSGIPDGGVPGLLMGLRAGLDEVNNATEGALTFPPPDIRIGNSPKWELQTFKRWLDKNVQAGSK